MIIIYTLVIKGVSTEKSKKMVLRNIKIGKNEIDNQVKNKKRLNG